MQAEPLEARPGSVVRWSAEDVGGDRVRACRIDGVDVVPVAGECFFPIDLLAEGELLAERLSELPSGGRIDRVWLRVSDDYPYPEQHIRLQSNRHVDLDPADSARAARESARIAELWELRTPRRFTLPLGAPLRQLPAGGRFGSRRFYNGQPRSPHTGADFAADTGTPVLATADGTVALAEEHFFGGKSVFLDHGDGLISMALHLSEISVEPGQMVRQGEVIGEVGSTGRSTGPHLHFGLRWRGARVDPQLLLAGPDALPRIP